MQARGDRKVGLGTSTGASQTAISKSNLHKAATFISRQPRTFRLPSISCPRKHYSNPYTAPKHWSIQAHSRWLDAFILGQDESANPLSSINSASKYLLRRTTTFENIKNSKIGLYLRPPLEGRRHLTLLMISRHGYVTG